MADIIAFPRLMKNVEKEGGTLAEMLRAVLVNLEGHAPDVADRVIAKALALMEDLRAFPISYTLPPGCDEVPQQIQDSLDRLSLQVFVRFANILLELDAEQCR